MVNETGARETDNPSYERLHKVILYHETTITEQPNTPPLIRSLHNRP